MVAFATSMIEAAPPGSLPERSTLIVPQGVVLPPSPAEAARLAAASAEAAAAAAAAAGELAELAAPPPVPATIRLPPTLHEALKVPRHVPVLLLPAGLRPVKDVLWAASAIERAAAAATTAIATTAAASAAADDDDDDAGPRYPPFILAVVGPALDAEYAAAVAARLGPSPPATTAAAGDDARVMTPAVVLLPPVDRVGMVSYMRDAAAVVNTSTSEGQSGALLEAAAVGTPIVARDIPGNRSLLDLIDDAASGVASAAAAAATAAVLKLPPAAGAESHPSSSAAANAGAAVGATAAATSIAAYPPPLPSPQPASASPSSFAEVSYGDSSSRDSRDSRGSVLALDSYEIHPCGVLCPTPESFAAAIVDALTPASLTKTVGAVGSAVYAAAERARARDVHSPHRFKAAF